MNIFNRVVVILLLLALAVLLVVFMVAPTGLIRELEVDFGLLGDALEIRGITFFSFTWNWVSAVLMALVLLIIVLLLLYLELRRTARRAAVVLGVGTGRAEVSTESIARRVEYNLQELPDVIQVRPRIRGSRRGVEVRLEVETSPEVDIPAKAEEICRLAQEVVEDRMGLRLDKEIQLRIPHAPYVLERPRLRVEVPPAPAPEPAEAAPEVGIGPAVAEEPVEDEGD